MSVDNQHRLRGMKRKYGTLKIASTQLKLIISTSSNRASVPESLFQNTLRPRRNVPDTRIRPARKIQIQIYKGVTCGVI
jgi:hypothetical protein